MADFVCPRCGWPTSAQTYGPCATCRSDLNNWGRTAGAAAQQTLNVKLNEKAEAEVRALEDIERRKQQERERWTQKNSRR